MKKPARRTRPAQKQSASSSSMAARHLRFTPPRVKVFVSPEPPSPKTTVAPRPKVNVWVGRFAKQPAPESRSVDLSLEDSLEDWEEAFLNENPPVESNGVKLLVSPPPKQRPWLGILLATLLWLGSGSFVAMVGCTAFWLIVNPGRVSWLGWALPEWNREAFIRDDTPRSWGAIQAEAAQQNRTLGTPLMRPVGRGASAGKATVVLVPVLAAQPRCADPAEACLHLVELRAYHLETPLDSAGRLSSDTRLQLGDRLPVAGPREFGVVSLLPGGAPAGQGSTRRLPLQQIEPIEGDAPKPDGWFSLSGQERRGSQAIAYGQIGYYDAAQRRLRLLISWSSLVRRPRWQAVTGDDPPELVVDQTVGLEPQFTVYQVKPAEGGIMRLEAIALEQPPFASQSLENALFLARNGLWSHARAWMEGYKKRNPKTWTAAAQAQLDLIALHAAATRAQAERDRASPSQRLATLIIDSRWEAAIALLQTALRDGADLRTLIGGDANRWRQRAEAMLRVDADHTDAQFIGGLVVMLRQGRDEAIAWLQTQNRAPIPKTPASPLHPRTQAVLRRLDQLPLHGQSLYPSRLIGTATPLPSPRPGDWDTPDGSALPTLPDGEVWYRISLTRYHDGTTWQHAPFSQLSSRLTPGFLWNQLGLGDSQSAAYGNRPTLQYTTWNPQSQMQSHPLTVRALRLQGSAIQLLASGQPLGDSLANRPHLVLSDAALNWELPTDSTSLAALHLQQPQQGSAILRTLATELRRARPNLPLPPADDPEALAQAFGSWSVQLADLTGDSRRDHSNRQPEVILVLHPDLLDPPPAEPAQESDDLELLGASPSPPAPSNAPSSAPPDAPLRTLIFSASGSLVYNGLTTNTQLVAIARLEGETAPVLVITQGDRVTLRRWLASPQRFEPID
ncbi:hypothetical protein P7L53_10065 [Thermoleptolyngbya sichuanensis XZ-Cy5]|uniref:hypothetical protein n=1 Tax=Thermoleptolyngbya sichuanensis TaxID=2885951 RepID=UPI00240D57F7|nr:hypothetical protein [Thermoleptolyngbya sichuanensis]MDG2616589.1 hypothetical protein [Thermoleptolyngbya sichuanensis XZ-Cy5]